jgi:hypothetical protein
MTTERQIAANRRNARKSTGPKSRSGKRRAAQNAWKHGLAASVTSYDTDPLIDKLAGKIAVKAGHVGIRQCARDIAAAKLELDRIRQVRIGLIKSARLFGLNIAEMEEGLPAEDPQAKDAAFVMVKRSSPEEEAADVLRRVLSDLTKILRYERHAAARRDKAFRRLSRLMRSRDP